MTPAQIATLDVVRDQFTEMGRGPTIREIARAVNVTVSGAHGAVEALVNAGLLRRTAAASRGLEPVDVIDLRTVGTDRLRGELARRGVTLEALRRDEQPAYGRRASCAADTCGIAVERGHLMCRRHWFSLPRDLREQLLAAHFSRDVDQFQELLTRAVDIADGLGG